MIPVAASNPGLLQLKKDMLPPFWLRIRDRVFYGWVVVIGCLIIIATILGARYSFGVFFKSIESEFDLTRAATSSIFSVYMVFCSAFAILGGWVLDRYGPKTVVFLMGLFTGLSLVLTSQTNASWQLFITYSLLLAIGTGAGFVVVMTTVSRWFIKKRGLALGIATSGEGLGTLVMAPFVVYLISNFGWRISYIVMGSIAGLVISGLSLLLRKNPGEIGVLPDGVKATRYEMGAPDKNEVAQPVSFSLSEALRTNSFWFLGAVWLLFSACYHLVLTHIMPHATDVGIPAATAALALSLIGGTGIAGRLLMGTVSDKIGRKVSAVICALLQAIAMVWVAWSQELWMLYVFAAAYGFAFGGLSTVVAALISDTFGLGSLGVITGALVVGFSTGAAIGPLIGGFIFDVSNAYFIAFLAGAAAMLITALLVALVKREPAGS